MKNIQRGEIALPNAGEGVFLCFQMPDLEMLETSLGEDFYEKIIKASFGPSVSVIRTCLEIGIKGIDDRKGEAQRILSQPPFEPIGVAVRDAIVSCLYGRTFDEQTEVEERKMLLRQARQLEMISEDPQLAALLSSRVSAEQDTEQD